MGTSTREGARFLEHRSEERLHLRALTWQELLRQAGQALASLLLEEQPAAVAERTPSGPPREIEVSSRDREALLVDWLNELIYLAETQLWVAIEFEVLECSPGHLRARAWGVPVASAPSLVKAATFHGLEVVATDDELEAKVILDV